MIDGRINLDRTVRIVHHLVDGKQSGLESSSSHSIYMKIKCISHFQFVQIFLIGSQLKHQGTFVYHVTDRLTDIEVFADIHLHVGNITTDRSLNLQIGMHTLFLQAGRRYP